MLLVQAVRRDGFSSDVKLLKALESENARLMKLVAERDLKFEIMKEIAAKNSERSS